MVLLAGSEAASMLIPPDGFFFFGLENSRQLSTSRKLKHLTIPISSIFLNVRLCLSKFIFPNRTIWTGFDFCFPRKKKNQDGWSLSLWLSGC